MMRRSAFLCGGFLMLGLLVCSTASAQHLMAEGVLRDSNGQTLNGQFDMTYQLYTAEDAEDAVWVETHVGQEVSGGFFQARLGQSSLLSGALFADNKAGLWLGITLSGQPELPRTPLETDPFAFHAQVAQSAMGLNCTGCVGPEALGGVNFAAASQAGGAALDLSCTGCVTLESLGAGVMAASNVSYDDGDTSLGAVHVQGAIEKLKDYIDAKPGGTGPGNVNEGNGTIVPYANQWGLPAFGVATEFVHMLNPTNPKVVTYLYGGENTGFASSNNLVVQANFTPNQWTGQANGTAGEDTLTVSNASFFNTGDHILIHQSVGKSGNGTDGGNWELNVVTGVAGNSLKLGKNLKNTYVSDDQANGPEAQVVLAASYNQLDVIGNGKVYPKNALSTGSTSNFGGGIVFIRAQTITVKSGGVIHADGYGYGTSSYQSNVHGYPGDSECKVDTTAQIGNNCSGGGGGKNAANYQDNRGGGGGGNKTAGATATSGGTGGASKGDGNVTTLQLGGGGGGAFTASGGVGGGLIVLGAKTIIVENGGRISANGNVGGNSSTSYNRAGGGGGAGGSVVLFANTIVNNGTVEAKGGQGGTGADGAQRQGGAGGEGWVIEKPPIPGSVNQTFATGVEIWVDGVNVTASVGDPNGKGHPHYDATNKKWGATGTDKWSSGQLDLTNVANWTLGEHVIQYKETGGAGGDLKGYTYVIYPFTDSKAPPNDVCATAIPLDPTPEGIVISGTTEDTMGKTKATDDLNQPGCGGLFGPDVVYQIDLAERSLLDIAITAPFSSKLYLRAATCADGELVKCADKVLSTQPLEPGTYFLIVDSDSAQAKGDFTLTATRTPAPLPENDTCATAKVLDFDDQGVAVIQSTSLYAVDDNKGLCPSALTGGPDIVYTFTPQAGQTLTVSLDAEFESILYVSTLACEGENSFPLTCSGNGELTLFGVQSTQYWLFIDGAKDKEWGDYTLTVELK